MISRVAECCFWLNRYVERVETMSRLVSVNRNVILDAGIHQAERWKPLVVVAGEQRRFEEKVGIPGYDDDDLAEEYLTWSEDNPTSIRSSLSAARDNARMTREVISREMWETINSAWQWLNSKSAHLRYKRDPMAFYQTIARTCAEYHGNCHGTMLHDEPFDFIRLGLWLERADQVARVIDVKHHWFRAGSKTKYETPQESAQWMALLRLCSAVEPFFKRHSSAPTGPLVLRFVLQELSFPRSLLHCADRAANFAERIDRDCQREAPDRSVTLARALVKRVRSPRLSKLGPMELHAELTKVIESLSVICNQIGADYFYDG